METKSIEIVLIEDNPYDAEMIIRALKKNNNINSIVHLKDGVEALDFFFGTGAYKERTLNVIPKVIFLDLKMPKVNGIEVLRKLRSDDNLKVIPIVILTSSKEDADIGTCYNLGANSYVVKPVGFENFSKSISDLGLYWVFLNESINQI
ncbi:response regulator [Aurantibacillus circumpalustris]|uniref:response regulator n=1 Tax=Aurantibacillus circumpalustris TaxID=3036359 RepID=UPI00295AE715|nr:response regulator [Aurantibacillus circumpalustris]